MDYLSNLQNAQTEQSQEEKSSSYFTELEFAWL